MCRLEAVARRVDGERAARDRDIASGDSVLADVGILGLDAVAVRRYGGDLSAENGNGVVPLQRVVVCGNISDRF